MIFLMLIVSLVCLISALSMIVGERHAREHVAKYFEQISIPRLLDPKDKP